MSDPRDKITIALLAHAAMREHRKDKPIAFQWPSRPPQNWNSNGS